MTKSSVPRIKQKSSVLHNNSTGSKMTIIPQPSSPPLEPRVRLNYPTTFASLLTAVLAGLSFPDMLTPPDGILISAPTHQLKQLTSSPKVPFHSGWGDGGERRGPKAAPTSKTKALTLKCRSLFYISNDKILAENPVNSCRTHRSVPGMVPIKGYFWDSLSEMTYLI